MTEKEFWGRANDTHHGLPNARPTKESKMKAYIGTKIIVAEPEVRDGTAGYKVVYPDGYASWSPKATFEAAYREVSPEEATLVSEA
jgi:hypothetical protein